MTHQATTIERHHSKGRMALTASMLAALSIFLPPRCATAQTNMSTILARYTNYDYPPADGNREIGSITAISQVEGDVDATPRDMPLALILVEPRLLNSITGSTYSAGDLKNRLRRFKEEPC